MVRNYVPRPRLPRAPKGGVTIPVLPWPVLYNYDHDTGLFEQLPAAPEPGQSDTRPSSDAADHNVWFGAGGDPGELVTDDSDVAILRADLGDAEWMREQLRKSGATQLLQVSDDDVCEVVIMFPACHAASRTIGTAAVAAVSNTGQDARTNPFATASIRLIHCKDGFTFCNTCSNPGCSRDRLGDERRRFAMTHPHQLDSEMSDVFGDCEPFCRCMAAAVQAIWPGGLSEFPEWLSMQEPSAFFTSLYSQVLHCDVHRVPRIWSQLCCHA